MIRATALAILIIASPALAHDWYPPNCCSDEDCHPVSCVDLEIKPDGSAIYKPENLRFNAILASQDTTCHVCFHKYANQHTVGFCAFAPGTS